MTISTSGVPPRLKSTSEAPEPWILPAPAEVDHLRGVLLEVGAVDPDVAEPAGAGKRNVVLADLVRLRVVGIEVVLAVEDRARRHLALERGGDLQRVADRLLVGDREDPGVGEADRAGVDVRLVAEGERAAAEHLRPRRELDVDLQPDHRLELRHRRPPPAGRRSRSSCSSANAASSRPCSAKAGAAIWKPTGSRGPPPSGSARPAGNRDRRDPGERHRHREEVVHVHRQRVVGLLAELEGDRRRGRGDDEVEVREDRAGSPRRSWSAPAGRGRSRRRSSRRRARRCRA